MSGWAQVETWIVESPRSVEILPPQAGEETLFRLRIDSRSTMGAIASETGGLLVDGGWLRLLGGGAGRLPSLADWGGLGDALIVEPVDRGLCVAFDAVGGFFVLLEQTRHVHSFLPDTLAWQDMGLTYSQFVHWALHGDLDGFYDDLRAWGPRAVGLAPDEAFSIHEADGTIRPVGELWALYLGGKLRELLLEARKEQ
jgi:hypothetical protein